MTEKKRNVNNLKSLFNGEVLKNVFADRARTNLLKKQEQIAISSCFPHFFATPT